MLRWFFSMHLSMDISYLYNTWVASYLVFEIKVAMFWSFSFQHVRSSQYFLKTRSEIALFYWCIIDYIIWLSIPPTFSAFYASRIIKIGACMPELSNIIEVMFWSQSFVDGSFYHQRLGFLGVNPDYYNFLPLWLVFLSDRWSIPLFAAVWIIVLGVQFVEKSELLLFVFTDQW